MEEKLKLTSDIFGGWNTGFIVMSIICGTKVTCGN